MKVLFIRFSSIGDIVLTSPVIRCTKQQLHGVEVHYLTKKTFAPILHFNPYVDKVYAIEKSTREIIRLLKDENYHCIIDLHHNLRSFVVKRALRKPAFSFRKMNIEKWLLTRFKVNVLPVKHIVDRYMQAVHSLKVVNDNKGLDYFIPPRDEVSPTMLPASHRQGFIGFVIGARHATKQLPVHKMIAVCARLQRPVVLLGGKEDAEKAAVIREAVGENVYNACGIYNLNQSASLIKLAEKIVTHDTGLMHIAAAFKKEIISVWGNTVPAFGMYPYLPDPRSKIVEVKHLSCRPCSKLGYAECPRGHFKCMNLLREEDIAG